MDWPVNQISLWWQYLMTDRRTRQARDMVDHVKETTEFTFACDADARRALVEARVILEDIRRRSDPPPPLEEDDGSWSAPAPRHAEQHG